jgi:hypothetical protein
MRFLYALRILTLLTAVSYFGEALPNRWLDWLETHFSESPGIYETGQSPFIFAAQIGVYIAVLLAIFLVFFAVPRFAWGATALSWCFLFMGACLLVELERGYWNRYLSAFIQISSYGRQICFALPPIVFGVFLRYHFVREALGEHPAPDKNV